MKSQYSRKGSKPSSSRCVQTQSPGPTSRADICRIGEKCADSAVSPSKSTLGDSSDVIMSAKSGIATVSESATRRSSAEPPSASADASSSRRICVYELHDVSSISSSIGRVSPARSKIDASASAPSRVWRNASR